jgi:hypothetical protein
MRLTYVQVVQLADALRDVAPSRRGRYTWATVAVELSATLGYRVSAANVAAVAAAAGVTLGGPHRKTPTDLRVEACEVRNADAIAVVCEDRKRLEGIVRDLLARVEKLEGKPSTPAYTGSWSPGRRGTNRF